MREKDSLKKIGNEVSHCQACKLYLNRTKTVPGEGNPKADIFFIGEGPGKNEDLEGRPFVGAAGKFLEEMLAIIKLKRSDVFIGNVVKCRPPLNRDPEEEEIRTCEPYLYRQLKIIKPKLIVTLGRFSLKIFIPNESISFVHGRLKSIRFKNINHPLYRLGPIYVLPLYHPAAALYRGNMRQIEMDDFKNIPKILIKLKGKIEV
jgi:DNA polymerase